MSGTTHRHPSLQTRFCADVGIDRPIVQTGMGWVSGVSLTAATAAAGGLGILAGTTMSFEQLQSSVRRMSERTDRPYGLNLRADQPDLQRRLDIAVQGGVRVISFAGAPTKDAIARAHDVGALVMPTVGARRHAEKMLEWGVDAVIAQGREGGGHTGSVPTSLLVPTVVDAVGGDIPVLAAGGFHDGRGLVAALAYGADGIAMGTRFLLTAESRVPDAIKERYLNASVTDTVVTSMIDGAPQRVIDTSLVRRLEGTRALTRLPLALRAAFGFRRVTGTSLTDLVREGLAMRRNQGLFWSDLVMAANAPMLTKATMVDGHIDVGILPTGQNVGVIEELPTVAELVDRIMDRADAVLRSFAVAPRAVEA